jgi:hypothetical protein
VDAEDARERRDEAPGLVTEEVLGELQLPVAA